MIALILFGKPGAGKGTQAQFIKEKYNLNHISTGDIFRYNLKNQTEVGKKAQVYIDKGELVPDNITINMLKAELEKDNTCTGFLFDGFPRTIEQADALNDLLEEKGIKFVGTIALDADDTLLIERILERGKTSGRTDDQDEEKIRNRYVEYNEKTAPLIEYYKSQNKYYQVDGIGEISEITNRLSLIIDKLI